VRGSIILADNFLGLITACSDPPLRAQDNVQDSFVDDTLWVDKYRPRQFTDLVGNEKVARDALGWVKQWDYCVFGKTRGKKRNRDDENINQDKYRRPHEKVGYLSLYFRTLPANGLCISDSFVVGASWSR
jgi:hypothetical protein